jgi:triosephosphate isomerase
MSKKIIIGNMKTKLDYDHVQKYIEKMKGKVTQPNVLFAPTSIYIPYFKEAGLKVCLQDIFFEKEGSYTGEILPFQAKSMGVRYAIVGHSERRMHSKENNQTINKKIKTGLESRMGIVLCVGETKEEKALMETKEVIRRQIFTALKGIDDLHNLVIAYEPIWAIGSGKIPSKRELQKIVSFIKEYIKEIKNGEEVRVIYGGSVRSKTIPIFNQIEDLDGYLIGGASTSAEEFLKIIEQCESL